MTQRVELLKDFHLRGALKRSDVLTLWESRYQWSARDARTAFQQLEREHLIWRGPAGWYLTALGKVQAMHSPSIPVAR